MNPRPDPTHRPIDVVGKDSKAHYSKPIVGRQRSEDQPGPCYDNASTSAP